MSKIYDSVDSSAVATHLLRQGLEKIYKTADIGQVKSFLITRCREIVRQSSILKVLFSGEGYYEDFNSKPRQGIWPFMRICRPSL